MQKYWDKVKKYKIPISIAAVIIIIIIAIILILHIDNKPNIPIEDNNTIENIVEPLPNDIDMLETIINNVDETEIEDISNRNNEQADIILENLGIDIRDVYSYAGSIDTRLDASHAILIVRPKEDTKDKIMIALANYINNKQNYLIGQDLDGTERYYIAEDATICEIGEYIALVYDENSKQIINNIVNSLKSDRSGLDEEVDE